MLLKRSLYGLALTLMLLASASGQNNLFLVFLNTNPDREKLPDSAVAELQKGHLENIGRLYDAGDLLLAGPFNGGGGIFVLTAHSLEDAEKLLASDPAISANRFLIETIPMHIDKGMICRQDEPYEMIMFNFLEFSPVNPDQVFEKSKSDASGAEERVIFAFTLNDGQFVEILPGDLDAESYAKDHPMVVNGQYSFEVRPWWSTDKTFCSDITQKLNY